MIRNQNLVLLFVVIFVGVLGYFSFTNNFSLKNYLKPSIQKIVDDDYISPYGPKPSKVWEKNWELERAK